MIRMAITVEAFQAIERTLPIGSVAVEPKVNEKGKREIWLEDGALNRLRLPRPSVGANVGESHRVERHYGSGAEGWSAASRNVAVALAGTASRRRASGYFSEGRAERACH